MFAAHIWDKTTLLLIKYHMFYYQKKYRYPEAFRTITNRTLYLGVDYKKLYGVVMTILAHCPIPQWFLNKKTNFSFKIHYKLIV